MKESEHIDIEKIKFEFPKSVDEYFKGNITIKKDVEPKS